MVEDLDQSDRERIRQISEIRGQLDACREENRKLKSELQKLREK